jgi:hypothetical protein
MLEEEIKKLWKNASAEELARFDKAAFMTNLDDKLQQTEAAIKKRDRLEIAVAIALVPVFGALAFVVPATLSKIGCVIIAAYCLLVIYKLRQVKKYKKPVNMGLPVREQLMSSRRYYEAERKLLDSVLWWYLLPPFVGIALFHGGISKSWTGFGIHMLIAFAVMAGIYALNKQAVKKEFNPLLEKIEKALAQLEE